MMQLISQNMSKGGVQVRVYYMMGGIKAMGGLDQDSLKAFFDYLDEHTPKEEQSIHAQALEIVFTSLVKKVLADTQELVDRMAKCIGVQVNLVFTDNLDSTVSLATKEEDHKYLH